MTELISSGRTSIRVGRNIKIRSLGKKPVRGGMPLREIMSGKRIKRVMVLVGPLFLADSIFDNILDHTMGMEIII